MINIKDSFKIGFIDYARFNGRDPKKQGSTLLRVDGVLAKDKDFGLWTQGAKWDALIFQKVYWQEMMEKFKGIKILDLCDPDFLKVEPAGGVELLKKSKLVDAITCSSEALTNQIKKYIKNIPVEYLPDRLNFDLFPEPKKHEGKARKVVWFGYSHNARKVLDNPMILGSLKSKGLKLIVVSDQDFIPASEKNFEVENIEYNADTAYYEIQKGDICINPQALADANFKYKSNNKTIIAWKAGLPVAGNDEELARLLNADERNKEVARRIKEVDRDYNIELSCKQYKEIICKIQSKKTSQK